MNKIDLLLNSIAQKHLQVDVLEWDGQPQLPHVERLRSALLDAFRGGVRYAVGTKFKAAVPTLFNEVDINLDTTSLRAASRRQYTQVS